MDVQLGGTHTYFGQIVYKPTLGDNIRPVESYDIRRGVEMMYLTSVLILGFFSLAYWMINIMVKGK